jgi:hypothetical protein
LTASFATAPSIRQPRRDPLVAAVVGVVGIVSFLALITAGLTFIGLAIAFPIAVPVAQSYGIPVSAQDMAIAQQFAQFAWVFAVLAVAAFTASIAVIVAVIRAVSPTPRD